ncbi:MAG: hypothetical protein ACRCUP_01580 [Mycoplasmatales bacterium]
MFKNKEFLLINLYIIFACGLIFELFNQLFYIMYIEKAVFFGINNVYLIAVPIVILSFYYQKYHFALMLFIFNTLSEGSIFGITFETNTVIVSLLWLTLISAFLCSIFEVFDVFYGVRIKTFYKVIDGILSIIYFCVLILFVVNVNQNLIASFITIPAIILVGIVYSILLMWQSIKNMAPLKWVFFFTVLILYNPYLVYLNAEIMKYFIYILIVLIVFKSSKSNENDIPLFRSGFYNIKYKFNK